MEHICVPANETLFLTYHDPRAIADILRMLYLSMMSWSSSTMNFTILASYEDHTTNTSKNPTKNISNLNGKFGTKLITTIIVKIKRDTEIV